MDKMYKRYSKYIDDAVMVLGASCLKQFSLPQPTRNEEFVDNIYSKLSVNPQYFL